MTSPKKEYLKDLFSNEFIKKMPVGYHLIKNSDSKDFVKIKVVSSDFYRADKFYCGPFYKPVTRCFKGYTGKAKEYEKKGI